MRFIFCSDHTFENWDYSSPGSIGIGGSETSAVEMAQRLAKAGHDVIAYAPTLYPSRVYQGVEWRNVDDGIDFELQGVWVVYRWPALADSIPAGQPIWLICQDVDYFDSEMMPERSARFTRIVALCAAQADYLKARHPGVADRVCISSNGIRGEAIKALVRTNPPARNPRRLMYASSPDRGLEFLLQIFPRAREVVNDLELHVFYGFDNIDRVIDNAKDSTSKKIRHGRETIIEMKGWIKDAMSYPGITWHGRVGQSKLMIEWLKSGIWCHPSNFAETSCITCMDAQACGAIPVTNPTWAISENVKHGIFIAGDVNEKLTQARYVLELIKLSRDVVKQEEIRSEMVPWALDNFCWDNFAAQWQEFAREDYRALALTGGRQEQEACA